MDDEWEDLPPRETEWQRWDRITAERNRLLAAGVRPVPVNGKAVEMRGWQDVLATPAIIAKWPALYPTHLNTGGICLLMPTLDIDILNPEAAEAIEALVRERYEERGYVLVRIGLAPKRAIPFRTDASFGGFDCKLVSPHTPRGKLERIEMRGRGQQIVMAGIHEDTGKPYTWHGGELGKIKLEELPYITEEEATVLVDDAVQLLVREFGYTVVAEKRAKEGNGAAHTGTGRTEDASIRERAYAQAALDGCAEELAETPDGSRNDTLNKKAFRLGTMVVRGWLDQAEVEEVLLKAAMACGLGEAEAVKTIRSGIEAGRQAPHPDLGDGTKQDEAWEDPRSGEEPHATRPVIKSSAEFVKGFVPPEYVVVGMLQRRFFYSFTAHTGHGKTAIMLILVASTALGTLFAGKETKKIRVLYLAAENADDVRMRWIALSQHMGFDVATIEVYFVEGRFALSRSLKLLRAEAERCGGEFGLVIVDTGPVFFEGKEENENKQLGDHARLLRSLVDTIPGGPCVVAACHPTKNATEDEIIPRGGGAYLAEVDGNMTAWKTDSTVELHWQGKFRGPDFAPMNFLIRTVTHQDLRDSDGRLIPTVIAEHISEQAKEDIAAAARQDEERALKFLSANPALTLSTLATAMGWRLYSGEPNKMRATRVIKELLRLKLIKETRAGRYKLTPEGEKVLKGETKEPS